MSAAASSGEDAAPVLLERHGSIAHLVLNRPKKLNALTPQGLGLIASYVAEVEADPSINVLIVRAEGRAFCAGADLSEVGTLIPEPSAFDAFLDGWHAAYDALAALSVPTIAAVQGAALAGGFELAHVCDFVVLGEGVPFGDQHANYGLYAAGGGTQRLIRLIGERRAKWLLMSGTYLDAHEAKAIGLVNDVVPVAEVLQRATGMAAVLAEKSPSLNAELKRTIRVGGQTDLASALAQERPFVLAHMSSADAQIGIQAFRDRTQPRFLPRRPAEHRSNVHTVPTD